MIASIIVEDKRDLSNCVFNLVDKENIQVSFRNNEIFVDIMDNMQGEIVFQNIKEISKLIVPLGNKKYLNGISIKINPTQFMHCLDMCNENEAFEIYICEEICKVIQGNISCSFPIMEIEVLEEIVYYTREIESKMNPDCLNNCSILEIKMKKITESLKNILRAERVEKFFPHYYIKINQHRGRIGKGDIRGNYCSIELDEFKFCGEPVEIETSGKFERVIKMFNPKQNVKIKCYNNSVLHFSQHVSLNTKIDFILSGMSKE